jgi:pSer/pThr/pTyr-binding forkhead associated (FHA) protein
MDLEQSAVGANALSPQLRLHEGQPERFAPLRLVLQPSGMAIDVGRPVVIIGRHSEADVRLPLPDVSRRHCQLVFGEAGWEIIDLNSLNGVRVNTERVLRAFLAHGDMVQIGGFTFAVDLSEPAAGVAPNGHVRSILETLSSSPSRKAS